LRRLLEKIYSASATVGGGALFIISLLITADVLIRWLAGKPIGGVFEITEVAFLIIVFLSMAFTQYSNRQIRIDILYTLLNKKIRSLFDVINGIAGLIFFGILLWTGTEEFIIAMNGNYVRRGLVEIPTLTPIVRKMTIIAIVTIIDNVAASITIPLPF
jgi:TRAP-type C4-dicarboxylate transport system permease small subunit